MNQNESPNMPPDQTTTFESTDRLGLRPFCERLERYLLVEHDYVDGGLVIGLNAGFGSGKTTFIRMWESDLLARSNNEQLVPMPVVLNAWESDYCGDPLLAILASLMEAVSSWSGDIDPMKKSTLIEAAKDAAWFALGLGNGIVTKLTGADSIKASDLAEKKRAERTPAKPDFIKLYQQRIAALTKLREKLAEVFGGQSPKVFVFVDELDRCRPDYAVSYLETIKHVFDVRGMVFVLGIDYDHLANSARSLFGQDLVFEEYFRKFCHRVVNLPKPDATGMKRLAEDYVKRFLEIEGKRICGINLADRLKEIVQLTVALEMKPRQLQEAFRIVGHVSSLADPAKRGQISWCIAATTILLAFLRVGRHETYSKMKDGQMSPEEVGLFLISIFGTRKAAWWFKIYLTGMGSNATPATLELEIILEKVGILEPGQAMKQKVELGQFHQGWDMSGGDELPDIFRRIEAVETFES